MSKLFTTLDAQWGGGVSKNPYLGFKVKDAQTGDRVEIRWEDNKGEKGVSESKIGQ